MRFILSVLILTIIIVIIIAPMMPVIRTFFKKKVRDLDRQFGGDQDEEDRL